MPKASQIKRDSPVMQKLIDEGGLEIKKLIPGHLIEGVVVSVSHGEILLDVGAKSEGMISGSEMFDEDSTHKNLKPGDTILAKVVQVENNQGYIVLSLKKAEGERKWRDATEAFESGSIIEAQVIEYNKGGLLSECLGLRGFIPLSHLDRVHFSEDIAKFAAGSEAELRESLKTLSGKALKVKVIELDREKNRFVLSEKDALSSYSSEAREKKLSAIEKDDILDGIVTGIMPFGVFVDLGGVEGLVHISEIAWEKVSHPGQYFSVGQSIKVMVLGVDDRTQKLALSVKRLMDNPWDTVEEKYPIGTKVKGKVNKIVPFGAFVTIEKGLDGLIHVSEADGPLEEGSEVKAIVTQVDGSKQKLALSVRQLKS
jgi:small subunit ribosomal protein S1